MAYDAVPARRAALQQYNCVDDAGEIRHSGTFTAAFKVHDPFGRMLLRSIPVGEEKKYGGTNLLPAAMMPAAPTAQDTSFLLYNPGTEVANTMILLAGSVGADGLTIRNAASTLECKIIGLQENTLAPGQYLSIDSEKGQVMKHSGADSELAFHFHDKGYLVLEPGKRSIRDIAITTEAGSKAIQSPGEFTGDMAGRWVFLGGVWHKTHRVDDDSAAHLTVNAEATGVFTSPVVVMNEIFLEGECTLTRLEVDYIPRTR